jgi:hypothetical protein
MGGCGGGAGGEGATRKSAANHDESADACGGPPSAVTAGGLAASGGGGGDSGGRVTSEPSDQLQDTVRLVTFAGARCASCVRNVRARDVAVTFVPPAHPGQLSTQRATVALPVVEVKL